MLIIPLFLNQGKELFVDSRLRTVPGTTTTGSYQTATLFQLSSPFFHPSLTIIIILSGEELLESSLNSEYFELIINSLGFGSIRALSNRCAADPIARPSASRRYSRQPSPFILPPPNPIPSSPPNSRRRFLSLSTLLSFLLHVSLRSRPGLD
ncbi:hypothetical protein BDV12DRAFT_33797 [Aspergillus spectabilis]